MNDKRKIFSFCFFRCCLRDVYRINDVRPKSFKVLSTVAWLGALRIWTRGGRTGTAGRTLVKWVVGICCGRGGGASRMTNGACSGGGGGWIRTKSGGGTGAWGGRTSLIITGPGAGGAGGL